MLFPDRLFITGTDTGVGKSLVAAVLVRGLEAEYWKPVQSGLQEMTDTEWVKEKTGLPGDFFHPETYRLNRPLSPHASAARDGVRIDLENFHVPSPAAGRHLVVEGAGGVMVPLNEDFFMLDLMKRIGAPVLLVASSSLGTINHTLLSLGALNRGGLDVMGVVMNGPKNPENRRAVEHFGRTPVVAEIGPLQEIHPGSLEAVFREIF